MSIPRFISKKPRIVSVALICATVGLARLTAGEETGSVEAPLEAAWRDAATFLFGEANRAFSDAKGERRVNEHERLLGEALTLLNLQPRTGANLALARERLETLASGSDSDDHASAVFAKYFLARIYERYSVPPRLDDARNLYRQLVESHAGNSVAEYGAAALVLIDLYENILATEREKRFAKLEELGALLKTPSGRRDYHLNMGNAYIDFEASRSKAIEHLIAGEAGGITRWQVESATWISIGELARVEGRNDLAVTYYGKFLAKYKRDNRHYTIQKRLEELAPLKN